jgi:hypothetical protein
MKALPATDFPVLDIEIALIKSMTGRNSEYLLLAILGISSLSIAGAVDQRTENMATAIWGKRRQ